MTVLYDKAKTLLTNAITSIETTGQLKTCVHIYNIACVIDDTAPSDKIKQALETLFDIVDGRKNPNIKAVNKYLKSATIN